jgi:hypothetical protein
MEKVIGETSYSGILFADMDGNKIKDVHTKYIEHKDRTYDGNNYLTFSSSGGSYVVDGVTYERGMELAEDFEPFFEDEETKNIILNEDYYNGEGHHCSDCGTFHNTDQYYNLSYVILNDCELFCKSCVEAEDMLHEVDSVEDFFRAKDMTNFPEKIKGYTVVETLFCDSSGWGNEREAALTERQAKARVQELLDKHGTLFAGLTGIGQFQVYVTLWKKRKARAKKVA